MDRLQPNDQATQPTTPIKDRDKESGAIRDFLHQVLTNVPEGNDEIVLIKDGSIHYEGDQDALAFVWQDKTAYLRLKSYGLVGSDWEANLTTFYKLVDIGEAENLLSTIPQNIRPVYANNSFRTGNKDIVCVQSSRQEAIPKGDTFAHQFNTRFKSITQNQLQQAVNTHQPIRINVPKIQIA